MERWHRALAEMLSCTVSSAFPSLAALWARTTASHVLTLHVRPYCILLGYVIEWLINNPDQFLFWVMSGLGQHREGKPGVCSTEAGAGALAEEQDLCIQLCFWTLISPNHGQGLASALGLPQPLADVCEWTCVCSPCAISAPCQPGLVAARCLRCAGPIELEAPLPSGVLMICVWQVLASVWKEGIECFAWFDYSESSEHTLLQFCIFARFHYLCAHNLWQYKWPHEWGMRKPLISLFSLCIKRWQSKDGSMTSHPCYWRPEAIPAIADEANFFWVLEMFSLRQTTSMAFWGSLSCSSSSQCITATLSSKGKRTYVVSKRTKRG